MKRWKEYILELRERERERRGGYWGEGKKKRVRETFVFHNNYS